MQRRAHIYLRVSTDEQADSGLGIAAQKFACLKFCKDNKLTLVSVHADEGVSGSEPLRARPALLQLVCNLQQGDTVVYLERSRLGRGVERLIEIDNAIARCKALSVSTEGEGTNSHAPTDVFYKQISDAVAELQLNTIRKKTKDALGVLRRRGQRYGNIPPLGYRHATKGKGKNKVIVLEPHANEQAALTAVREARDCGCGSSLSCISQQLAERGLFNRNGKPYTKSTISRMFKQLAWVDANTVNA